MKSFTELLSEKKDHYIKKMPNLSQEQKDILIAFFEKKSTLENKIDWNKWRKLTFDDFSEVMGSTTSSRKRENRKLRHQGIKGIKEGKDYIHVIIKNKKFLVYIPLNFKAAQIIASKHIGGVHADWCIANSQARKYFKNEIKKNDYVPIIVIGNNTKYAVIYNVISDYYVVWSAENDIINTSNQIYKFDIRKELLTDKLIEMYYEIINQEWSKEGETSGYMDDEDYDDAVESYEILAADIDYFIKELEDNVKDYNNYMGDIWKDTLEDYRKQAAKEEKNAIRIANKGPSAIDIRIKEIQEIISTEPTGTGVNDNGEIVWNLRGVDYTMDELNDVFKFAKKEHVLRQEESEPDFDERDELLDIVEYIENLDISEIVDDDNKDIEWSNDPYSFQDYTPDCYPHAINSHVYEDYFDFAEDYFNISGSDIIYIEERLEELSSMVEQEYFIDDGERFLVDCDCPHPREARKELEKK